jgi:hypothetical protein
MTPDEPEATGPLTAFQVDVARVFFAQPDAAGFLLAGGAAHAAHGLTERPTQDLDLFTRPGSVSSTMPCPLSNLPPRLIGGPSGGSACPRRSPASLSRPQPGR